MAIWFDVDDLVRWFCFNVRPTGIQRLSLALFRELQAKAIAGEAIYFCRRQPGMPFFRRIDFPILDARLSQVIDTPPAALAPKPARRSPAPDWTQHLSPRQRHSLGRIRKATGEITRAAWDFCTKAPVLGPLADVDIFDTGGGIAFAPDDWLINLGSSWHTPYQPDCLAYLHEAGAKFGVLVYDMIPEMFPEWTAPGNLMEFRAWLRDTLPQADLLFALSENTAADIGYCLTQAGQSVPPIAKFQVGTPLSPPVHADGAHPQRPYVLLVSTVEIRKNHALMFRVWQALLARYAPAQIPDLVFAGKAGWLTSDFLCQLDNAGWLNGKIRFCESPTDTELARLYRQCLFTVYPSFYEGWGLPVTESLAHGKMVAASNRASIPEAGGEFCVYFDPENIQQATATIEELIRNPERIAAFERHIAQNYRPPSWQDSAGSLVNALIQPPFGSDQQVPAPVTYQAA